MWIREFADLEIVLRCTVVVSPSIKKWLIRRTNIETREKRDIILISIKELCYEMLYYVEVHMPYPCLVGSSGVCQKNR
jgi:hypothetical protein